jgi:hypothetical protein
VTDHGRGVASVLSWLPGLQAARSYRLTRTIDPRHFFPTLESAVTAFRQETGAEWTAADQATDHPTGPDRTDAATGPPRDIPASPPVS